MNSLTSLLEQAVTITEQGAKIAASYFRQAILIEVKDNLTPVTIADKKAEEAMRTALTASFPEFGIRGEEFGAEGGERDLVWTVDPIDGTKNFIRGIPLWGTLLGLLEKGEPILGVMVLPGLNETYAAAKGLGARCNGAQIHVSNKTTLESALISFGDRDAFEDAEKLEYMNTLFSAAELPRMYTDCFGHGLVARGAVDAMVDPIINLWDVAPLACIIEEAGGAYFTFDDEKTVHGTSFISCTPALKDQLLLRS